jgi:hypothetical protein
VLTPGGRVAYRAGPGAAILGPPQVGPDGETLALVERDRAGYAIVVVVPGGEPLRFAVTRPAPGEGVYFIAEHELVLGPSLLEPRIRVTWQVGH